MQIFIKTLEGRTVAIEMKEDDKITLLFDQIEKNLGIPCDEQRLVHEGKPVSTISVDGTPNTLKSCGIQAESHVWVMLRIKAGSQKIPTCVYCTCEMAPENIAISCSKSHGYCKTNGCYLEYAKLMVLPRMKRSFPPNCLDCSETYTLETIYKFIKLLPEDMREIIERKALMYHHSKKMMTSDEWIVHCPTPDCEYAEIHTKILGMDYLNCRRCKQKSCVYCFKRASEDHTACASMGCIKQMIECAVKEGLLRRCPKCNCGGVKDDACTKMSCGDCKYQYCYVCLRGEADVDLSLHKKGSNFLDDKLFCPQTLNLMPGFPKDENIAVFEFHKRMIIRYLKDIFEKYGDLAEKTYNYYRIGKVSGISISDIKGKVELLPQVKLVL